MLKTIKNKNVKSCSSGNRDLPENPEAQKKWQLFIYRLMFTAFCVMHSASSFSQSPNWQWAKSAGGTVADYGGSCSTDGSGNVFATGSFYSSSITFGSTVLMNAGGSDIFIVKYDGSGNVLWAKSAGGTSFDGCSSCSTDGSGNVFVTGSFYSFSITFGTTILTNAGSDDMFIVKYDPSGNVLWAKSAGGTSGDWGWGCASDASGNVFVTGSFTSPSITFGTTIVTNANAGSLDMFIVKYDPSGNVLWANSAGGVWDDYGWSCSTDGSGNVFVTGSFASDTITFGTTTLTNADNTGTGSTLDIFVVKYDSSGNVLWANSTGGTSLEEGYSCSTDGSGNVFVTGSFYSFSITFGTTTLTNAGWCDLFIVKYGPSGNVLWANSAGGIWEDPGWSCSTDGSGNVFVTGYFESSSITFGTTTLTNAGIYDIFIVKYSPSGNCLWAKRAGGTDDDYGKSCSTDGNGNVFVTGYFWSPSITFGTTTLTNAGNEDIFVAKLDTCISSNFSQSLTLCTGQSITVGTNTYTASGTYTDIFTAANGCDSTVTTNLTANSSPASYQWVDCSNGYSLIAGEINQNFTASASGSYAVIVTENGCSDTSSCYTVTVTGITETILENNLLVYLNPGNFFFWVSGLRSAVYSLEIYNVYGEKVYSGTLDMKQETWNCDLRPQPNGIYFLTLKSNSETAPKAIRTTQKIIINR